MCHVNCKAVAVFRALTISLTKNPRKKVLKSCCNLLWQHIYKTNTTSSARFAADRDGGTRSRRRGEFKHDLAGKKVTWLEDHKLVWFRNVGEELCKNGKIHKLGVFLSLRHFQTGNATILQDTIQNWYSNLMPILEAMPSFTIAPSKSLRLQDCVLASWEPLLGCQPFGFRVLMFTSSWCFVINKMICCYRIVMIGKGMSQLITLGRLKQVLFKQTSWEGIWKTGCAIEIFIRWCIPVLHLAQPSATGQTSRDERRFGKHTCRKRKTAEISGNQIFALFQPNLSDVTWQSRQLFDPPKCGFQLYPNKLR